MGSGFQCIIQGQQTAVLFAGRVFLEDIPQGVQAAAPGTVQVMIDILRIIELAQLPLAQLILRYTAGIVLGVDLCKENKAPQLRIMDIDNSGRGPDPVILRQRISLL